MTAYRFEKAARLDFVQMVGQKGKNPIPNRETKGDL